LSKIITLVALIVADDRRSSGGSKTARLAIFITSLGSALRNQVITHFLESGRWWGRAVENIVPRFSTPQTRLLRGSASRRPTATTNTAATHSTRATPATTDTRSKLAESVGFKKLAHFDDLEIRSEDLIEVRRLIDGLESADMFLVESSGKVSSRAIRTKTCFIGCPGSGP
jgi:hypothetical protein